MPSTTSFAQLYLYGNTTEDKNTLFSEFRENLAGVSPTSNMKKIDSYLSSFDKDIKALKDTTGIITIHATDSGGGNNFIANDVSEFSEYKDNMLILLSIPQNSAGLTTLNINDAGIKSLMKIDNSGVAVNLESDDLKKNVEYLFRYDGSKFILYGEKFESVVTSESQPTNQVVGGIWNQITANGSVKTQVKFADGSYGYIPPQTNALSVFFTDGTSVEAFKSSLSSDGTIKWEEPININGMLVDGSANRTNYGICSTDADTADKTVDCEGFGLITGSEITVKFAVNNTAENPTLNVNNTGAKPIFYRGLAIPAGHLAKDRVYTFRYDGTNYDLTGDIDTDVDTRYDVMGGATESTPGKAGLAPAPEAGAEHKFLRGDATYQSIDAEAVGAVAKTGDTMSGNLIITDNNENIEIGELTLSNENTGMGIKSMGDMNLLTAGNIVIGNSDGGEIHPKITGVGEPTDDNDVANKKYVDDTTDNYLPLAGGTLTGNEIISNASYGNLTFGKLGGMASADGMGIKSTATSNGLILRGSTISVQKNDAGDYVNINGVADPTANNHAANKKYADTKVSKTGDTMTGPLHLAPSTTANSSVALAFKPTDTTIITLAARDVNRVGFYRASGKTILGGVETPVNSDDVATKKYVDTTAPHQFDLGQTTSKKYTAFMRFSNESSGEIAGSCLVATAGDFGNKVGGMWIVEAGNRRGTINYRVTQISKESAGDAVVFGYWVEDDYFYIGIGGPTYRGVTAVTVLSKNVSTVEFADFGDLSSQPSGWTSMTITTLVPKTGSVTITTSSWAEWKDTNNNDLFRVKITVPGVTANHRIDFYMDYGTEMSLPAPIKPMNDNGTVYAVTSTKPTANVTVQYDMTLTV